MTTQNETPFKKEFTVECKVCGKRYNNLVGSTPCCGSIAFIVEDNKVTDRIVIYCTKGK